MKKCILIPSSFKGTMDAKDICSVMSEEIHNMYPECDIISLPIAEGGEGTVKCFHELFGWRLIDVNTTDFFGNPITVPYAVNDDDNTALIEASLCAGRNVASDGNATSTEASLAAGHNVASDDNTTATDASLATGHNVASDDNTTATDASLCESSTYGVGLIVKDAVTQGYKNIYIDMNNCFSYDGGTGLAAALGTVYEDADGNSFVPHGSTLEKIKLIDNSICLSTINGVNIIGLSGTRSPMHGPSGCACVFAPYMGASTETVIMLNSNLEALDNVFQRELNKKVATVFGSGTGGGMGAGILALLNGRIELGVNPILDLIHFDDLLTDTDYIFTGEGRLDNYTLLGKSVFEISKRVKEISDSTPVVAFVGENHLDFEATRAAGISAVIPVTPSYMGYEEARVHVESNLRNALIKMLVSRTLF